MQLDADRDKKLWKYFFGVCVAATLVVFSVFFLQMVHGWGTSLGWLDFGPYYRTAVMWKLGVRENLYNLDLQDIWQQKIFPGSGEKGLLPYISFPTGILWFLPLAGWGNNVQGAYLTMLAVNFILLVGVWAFWAREKVKSSRWNVWKSMAVYWCQMSGLIIFWLAMLHNQLTILIFFVFVMSGKLLKDRKDFPAGLVLAVLLVKPNWLVFPVIWLIFKKRLTVLAGLGLGLGIGVGLALVLAGWNGLAAYGNLLGNIPLWGESFGVHPQMQPDLAALLLKIKGTNYLAEVLRWWWFLVLLTGGWWMIGSLNNPERKNQSDLWWSGIITMSLFANIHAGFADMCLLVIPMYFLFKDKWSMKIYGAWNVLTIFLMFVPWLAPVLEIYLLFLIRKRIEGERFVI